MKIEIDFDNKEILTDEGERITLYSDEGFALVKDLWLRVGWNQKYNYTFTWFGDTDHPVTRRYAPLSGSRVCASA